MLKIQLEGIIEELERHFEQVRMTQQQWAAWPQTLAADIGGHGMGLHGALKAGAQRLLKKAFEVDGHTGWQMHVNASRLLNLDTTLVLLLC